jgi:hypothetical protein
MPATIIDKPRGIACVFCDGSTTQLSLDGLPFPELARDLLSSFFRRSTMASWHGGHLRSTLPSIRRRNGWRGRSP